MPIWELERAGEVVRIDPIQPLGVRLCAAVDGLGITHQFEGWLRPHLDSNAVVPVLEPWWQSFAGPFLFYPGRRYLPAPIRAFVDFI
jgi:DNA-binding transcriptional LysR family regulator